MNYRELLCESDLSSTFRQPYLAGNNFYREWFQRSPYTGSRDAFAGQRFVGRTVGLANEMAVLGIKEAPITIIERYRDVSADIFISDDLAVKDRNKALARNAFLTVSEFKRLLFLQFGKGN